VHSPYATALDLPGELSSSTRDRMYRLRPVVTTADAKGSTAFAVAESDGDFFFFPLWVSPVFLGLGGISTSRLTIPSSSLPRASQSLSLPYATNEYGSEAVHGTGQWARRPSSMVPSTTQLSLRLDGLTSWYFLRPPSLLTWRSSFGRE